MMAEIDAARTEGSTLGGVFEVVAWGAPVGLGSHVQWDRKLDARLTQAIVSINAVKGAEIGPAFANAAARGHDVHDEIAIDPDRGWARLSNRAGGFEGGMTNGQPIVVRGALKPHLHHAPPAAHGRRRHASNPPPPTSSAPTSASSPPPASSAKP